MHSVKRGEMRLALCKEGGGGRGEMRFALCKEGGGGEMWLSFCKERGERCVLHSVKRGVEGCAVAARGEAVTS